MYSRILVPIDGSPCSDEAVADAVGIAKAMGSRVTFLFALDTLSAYREGVVNAADAREILMTEGNDMLDHAQQSASGAGVSASGECVEGTPAQVIARLAGDFDLVVMGSHGKGLWERITVGSVTEAVLRHVTKPVLIVRRPQATIASR